MNPYELEQKNWGFNRKASCDTEDGFNSLIKIKMAKYI